MLAGGWGACRYGLSCFIEAAGDAVHHYSERMDQQLFAAGEIVADRAHCKAGFLRNFPQRCALKAITGDNPEYCFHHILPSQAGIYVFGHQSYLAHMCWNPPMAHRAAPGVALPAVRRG